MMKNRVLAITAAVLCCAAAAKAGSNVAYENSQVRFTVVSDGVVRMEWHPGGRFVDEPSLLASERDYPRADYKVDDRRGTVTVVTPKMTVSYRKGTGAFSRENLRVRSAKGVAPAFDWRPGDVQRGNLKGTARTLDGLDGDVQTQTWVSDMKPGQRHELGDGILATDGWTLLDDSQGYIMRDGWVAGRDSTAGAQDWYFMAYGHDYKSALRDYTLFAGRVPLPPRFAFGYWWSRYWAYSDTELQKLVDKFDAYDIPLDVLVVDMDWHYTDPGRGGWTGWTWNRSLFPDPEGFMNSIHDKGIKVTLNLHPADGFEPYEKCYPSLAAALGRTDGGKIEWLGSDRSFMKAVMDSVLHPMERAGVDFWWLDWQQHLYDRNLERLDNTWWVNHCFFTDMESRGNRRPLLYHRWGGLGNHRYQVGFSGDAVISWKSLAYQPYFTSTASNVLYGYWSHDLGGHLGTGAAIDPEMYARWLQYGAYSPIMRTHSSKDPLLNKEPWVFADGYRDIVRDAVRARYSMVPYIYTMARKTHDEGISLCRPMYYDWPGSPEAYEFKTQYMFGDDMLIAPVVEPSGADGYAGVDLWLPEGEWYEQATGTLLEGGRHRRHFAAGEYGVYIRGGAVLPSYAPGVRRLDRADEAVVLDVYPGTADSRFSLYEDAGNDCGYDSAYARTEIVKTSMPGKILVGIGPREGHYDGMPACRDYTVRLHASAAPESVSANGRPIDWTYDGEAFAAVVPLGMVDCSEPMEIELRMPEDATFIADGFPGRARRIANAVEYIKFHGCDTHADELASLGTAGRAAAYDPGSLAVIKAGFDRLWNELPAVLDRQGMASDVRDAFLARAGYGYTEK